MKRKKLFTTTILTIIFGLTNLYGGYLQDLAEIRPLIENTTKALEKYVSPEDGTQEDLDEQKALLDAVEKDLIPETIISAALSAMLTPFTGAKVMVELASEKKAITKQSIEQRLKATDCPMEEKMELLEEIDELLKRRESIHYLNEKERKEFLRFYQLFASLNKKEVPSSVKKDFFKLMLEAFVRRTQEKLDAIANKTA